MDASAHQTLCQICRNEGDLVLYRKAGADLSDPSEVFVLPDVVSPFDVTCSLHRQRTTLCSAPLSTFRCAPLMFPPVSLPHRSSTT